MFCYLCSNLLFNFVIFFNCEALTLILNCKNSFEKSIYNNVVGKKEKNAKVRKIVIWYILNEVTMMFIDELFIFYRCKTTSKRHQNRLIYNTDKI